MPSLKLEISGPDADGIAAELAEQLEGMFGVPILPDVPDSLLERDVTREPIAVAALVLSIPAALLATIDLAVRLKLPERWAALRQWAREVSSERGQIVVTGDVEVERVLTGTVGGEGIEPDGEGGAGC